MQDIKNDIVEWNIIQEKINQQQKLLNDIKERSKKLEDKIINSLKNNKINNKKFVIENYLISCKSFNKYENITKKYLQNILNNYFRNEERSRECLEFIYQKRGIVNSENLVRTKKYLKETKK